MNRLPMLDCLRAWAILLVLGRHVSDEYLPEFLQPWKCGGWSGVNLFFVLSGFLIGNLLFAEHQKHGSISISRFYIRRSFKIYPQFYFFVAVTVAYWLITEGKVWRRAVLVECIFLQNYLPGLWVHTWSLAVEEHFYVLLPLLLSCIRFKWVPTIFVALAVACFVTRLFVPAVSDNRQINFGTHLHIDSLFFGVVIAYLYRYQGEKLIAFSNRFSGALLACGIALFVPMFLFEPDKYPWIRIFGVVLLYIGAACLITWAIPLRVTSRYAKAFAFIGSYSYSLYLWHMVAIEWIAVPAAGDNTPLFWSLYLGSTALLGIVTAHAIEYPALAVRDRYFKSKA